MTIVPLDKKEFQDKVIPEMAKILTPEQYELYEKIVATK